MVDCIYLGITSEVESIINGFFVKHTKKLSDQIVAKFKRMLSQFSINGQLVADPTHPGFLFNIEYVELSTEIRKMISARHGEVANQLSLQNLLCVILADFHVRRKSMQSYTLAQLITMHNNSMMIYNSIQSPILSRKIGEVFSLKLSFKKISEEFYEEAKVRLS
jgi:hypothetical protein